MKKGIILTPEDLVSNNWLERMRRLKLNTLGIHSGGSANHDVLQRLGQTATEEFREQCGKANIRCEYELHAAASLLPPDLFMQNPQCFAMDLMTGLRTCCSNPCVTNPQALEIIEENACRLALELPSSTHHYYFWGADQANGFCHCPNCAKFSCSDLNLLFMNAVAKGVSKADPKGKVACLIYIGCYELPQKIRPEENISFEFAPFVRCYQHAIDDSNCNLNRRFLKSFQEYKKVFGTQRMQVLEYWLDSSLFSQWKKPAVEPKVSSTVLKRDLEFYIRSGIKDISTFAVFMDREYMHRFGEQRISDYAAILNELLHG